MDEIVVVDNGSEDDTAEVLRARPGIKLLEPGRNLGIAGRNLAAREASGDLLLMLDDDAYPLPGAIETLREAFVRDPQLAGAGGLVRDVDDAGNVALVEGPGTFDWFMRSGDDAPVPAEGIPTWFVPEGASMVRRDAFLEVGGFFEPYFFTWSELDLATRLFARGWELRYLPEAKFDHMKPEQHSGDARWALTFRVRNQLWYFWLRFPPFLAVRRMLAYAAFDFVESAYRGVLGTWARGVWEAWTQREKVRRYRDPLPRRVLRRAEMRRGRLHLRLLLEQIRKRLPGS